jgi:hypothetical protein
MGSVLQDWVMELPLRAQGTLMTGIRGCDLAPKIPTPDDRDDQFCSTGECSPERHLVAFLRWCVLNPADPREVDLRGAWFQSSPPDFKPSMFGHYPLHWYSHLMHCFEVIGYLHPDHQIREECYAIYHRLARGLHLRGESHGELLDRLTEDRIAAGTVVS